VFDAGEIYGGSLTGMGAINRFATGLHAAHSQELAAGKKLDFVSWADAAGNQRSGYYGAKALDGERAIDGEAEVTSGAFSWNLLGGSQQGVL